MKIGLLGVQDPADVRSYSGTPFHLGHFLRAAGHEVRSLGPYPLQHRTWLRIQNRLSQQFFNRQTIWERHKLIASQYPGVVRRYAESNPDLDLLLGTSAFYLAKAKAKLPLVFWGDTTIAGVIDGYTRYKNLSSRTIAQCHAVEQDALDACDLAIYSNQWAADIAVSAYRLNPAKVRVITYGANLLETPGPVEMESLLENRSSQRIKFIIIGWDWQRKGFPKAIDVVGELRNRGMNVTLDLVGCLPPKGSSVPNYVKLLGVIPKFTPEGRLRMAELIGNSHLLILPTIAECAAVVLSEASAFGVPALSTHVGGNSSLIKQNINGILLSPDAGVSEWADAAMRIISERSTYERFAMQSYRLFRDDLSWTCAVAKFERVTRDLVGTSVSPGFAYQTGRLEGRG